MKYKFKEIDETEYNSIEDYFSNDYEVYVKPGVYAMSTRKLESLIKIAQL